MPAEVVVADTADKRLDPRARSFAHQGLPILPVDRGSAFSRTLADCDASSLGSTHAPELQSCATFSSNGCQEVKSAFDP